MCRLWKVVRRMSRKNGAERIAGIAQHAKALNSIAKAFIQGGWQAAAVQSVKATPHEDEAVEKFTEKW